MNHCNSNYILNIPTNNCFAAWRLITIKHFLWFSLLPLPGSKSPGGWMRLGDSAGTAQAAADMESRGPTSAHRKSGVGGGSVCAYTHTSCACTHTRLCLQRALTHAPCTLQPWLCTHTLCAQSPYTLTQTTHAVNAHCGHTPGTDCART